MKKPIKNKNPPIIPKKCRGFSENLKRK